MVTDCFRGNWFLHVIKLLQASFVDASQYIIQGMTVNRSSALQEHQLCPARGAACVSLWPCSFLWLLLEITKGLGKPFRNQPVCNGMKEKKKSRLFTAQESAGGERGGRHRLTLLC